MISENSSGICVNAPKSKLNNEICKSIHDNLPKQSHTSLFVGQPSSGKSSLMEHMLSNKQCYNRKYDSVLLVAPATSMKCFENSVFKDHPDEKKFSDLNRENLTEIINMIEETRDKDENTLLILDDVQSSLKDPYIEKRLIQMFSNFRHLRTTIWILAQNLVLVPKQIRILAQNYFLFQPYHRQEFEYIKDEVLSWIPRKEVMSILNYVYDKPHQFLMVNKKKKQLYKNFNLLNFKSVEKDDTIL